MSEMVERVAMAISPEWFGERGKMLSNYDGQDLNFQELARKKARAAVESMREPSDKMIEAGAKAMVGSDEDAMECWPAMIDEALK